MAKQREFNGYTFIDNGHGDLYNEELDRFLIFRPYPLMVETITHKDDSVTMNRATFNKNVKDNKGVFEKGYETNDDGTTFVEADDVSKEVRKKANGDASKSSKKLTKEEFNEEVEKNKGAFDSGYLSNGTNDGGPLPDNATEYYVEDGKYTTPKEIIQPDKVYDDELARPNSTKLYEMMDNESISEETVNEMTLKYNGYDEIISAMKTLDYDTEKYTDIDSIYNDGSLDEYDLNRIGDELLVEMSDDDVGDMMRLNGLDYDTEESDEVKPAHDAVWMDDFGNQYTDGYDFAYSHQMTEMEYENFMDDNKENGRYYDIGDTYEEYLDRFEDEEKSRVWDDEVKPDAVYDDDSNTTSDNGLLHDTDGILLNSDGIPQTFYRYDTNKNNLTDDFDYNLSTSSHNTGFGITFSDTTEYVDGKDEEYVMRNNISIGRGLLNGDSHTATINIDDISRINELYEQYVGDNGFRLMPSDINITDAEMINTINFASTIIAGRNDNNTAAQFYRKAYDLLGKDGYKKGHIVSVNSINNIK